MVKKIDVSIGQFSVSVLLRGVVDSFDWACTGLLVPMLINIVLLYGRSYLGFVSSGTQLGFYSVILILLDTPARGLVVILLIHVRILELY